MKKHNKVFLCFFALNLLLGSLSVFSLDDLEGTWKVTMKGSSKRIGINVLSLNADGSYISGFQTEKNETPLFVIVKGAWRVENKKIYFKVGHSSYKNESIAGQTITNSIKVISSDEFEMINIYGNVELAKRASNKIIITDQELREIIKTRPYSNS